MSNKKTKETDEEKCLRIFLDDGKPFQEPRFNALRCLEEIGGEKTFNAIQEALHKKLFLDWQTRDSVIGLLGSLGGKQVVDMLLNLLEEEEHDTVREGIIESIGSIQQNLIAQGKEMSVTQQQKVVLHLCQLLSGKNKDTNWCIRRTVVWTLEGFKCEQSILALKTALSDEEEEVRERAKKSLFYKEFHGRGVWERKFNKPGKVRTVFLVRTKNQNHQTFLPHSRHKLYLTQPFDLLRNPSSR